MAAPAQQQHAEAPAAGAPLDPEAAWRSMFEALHITDQKSGHFSGYVGEWARFDAEGNVLSGPGGQQMRWNGLRVFKKEPDESVQQVNIYSIPTPGSTPRDDGGNSKSWQFSLADHVREDGIFHPFMVERGPLKSRAVAAASGALSSITFGLPLEEFVKHYEKPPPVYATEVFFRRPDERRGWSGGALYSTATGELQYVYFIREYAVNVADPSQPFQLTGRDDVPPSRPRLPADPASWLQGSWQGTSEGLLWDAEQNVTYEAGQPAEWALPPNDHRLTLLPDLFYVSGPPSLPKRAADVPAHGVSTQMGGFISDTVFRRTTIQYDASGRIQRLRNEQFTKAD